MQGFFPSSTVQIAKSETGLAPKCGACGLYKTCASPKMDVFGKGKRGVLFVGESPDDIDDELGRPFAGRTGTLLKEALAGLGISMDRDAWLTNALICHNKHGGIDPKRIGYCRPNMVDSLKAHAPLVVVPLGRSSLDSVIRDKWSDIGTMERWAGWTIPLENFWVVPTFHPSYVKRMDNKLVTKLFEGHLQKAFELQDPPPPPKDYGDHIEALYKEKDVLRALKDMDRVGGWVAVDYETNCLKPEYEQAKAVSFAISNGDRTVSYLLDPDTMRYTSRFLRSERTKKIASNLKFEERWTRFLFGHGVANWGWDTMLAAHCLDNRQGICSLKFQAFVKLGVPVYNANIEPYLFSKGPYNRVQEIAHKDLLFYGGMDVKLEYDLAMVQRKEMRE